MRASPSDHCERDEEGNIIDPYMYSPIPEDRLIVVEEGDHRWCMDAAVLLEGMLSYDKYNNFFTNNPLSEQVIEEVGKYRLTQVKTVTIVDSRKKGLEDGSVVPILIDSFDLVGDLHVDVASAVKASPVDVKVMYNDTALNEMKLEMRVSELVSDSHFVVTVVESEITGDEYKKLKEFVSHYGRYDDVFDMWSPFPADPEEERQRSHVRPVSRSRSASPSPSPFYWYPVGVAEGLYVWDIGTEEDRPEVVEGYKGEPMERGVSTLITRGDRMGLLYSPQIGERVKRELRLGPAEATRSMLLSVDQVFPWVSDNYSVSELLWYPAAREANRRWTLVEPGAKVEAEVMYHEERITYDGVQMIREHDDSGEGYFSNRVIEYFRGEESLPDPTVDSSYVWYDASSGRGRRSMSQSQQSRNRQATPSPSSPRGERSMSHSPQGRSQSHSPQGRSQSHSPQGRSMSHSPQGRSMSHSPQGRSMSHSPQGRSMSHSPRGERSQSHSPQGRSMPYPPPPPPHGKSRPQSLSPPRGGRSMSHSPRGGRSMSHSPQGRSQSRSPSPPSLRQGSLPSPSYDTLYWYPIEVTKDGYVWDISSEENHPDVPTEYKGEPMIAKLAKILVREDEEKLLHSPLIGDKAKFLLTSRRVADNWPLPGANSLFPWKSSKYSSEQLLWYPAPYSDAWVLVEPEAKVEEKVVYLEKTLSEGAKKVVNKYNFDELEGDEMNQLFDIDEYGRLYEYITLREKLPNAYYEKSYAWDHAKKSRHQLPSSNTALYWYPIEVTEDGYVWDIGSEENHPDVPTEYKGEPMTEEVSDSLVFGDKKELLRSPFIGDNAKSLIRNVVGRRLPSSLPRANNLFPWISPRYEATQLLWYPVMNSSSWVLVEPGAKIEEYVAKDKEELKEEEKAAVKAYNSYVPDSDAKLHHIDGCGRLNEYFLDDKYLPDAYSKESYAWYHTEEK